MTENQQQLSGEKTPHTTAPHIPHMTVTLLIPAYNEEKRLPRFLDALTSFLSTHQNLLHAVFIIDDGSKDATVAVAETYRGRLPGFQILHDPINQGKGAAIQRGVNAVKTEGMIFLDADGATPPEELPRIVEMLHSFPIVVGNRWSKESEVRGQTPLRAASSVMLRTYMGLFGLSGIDTMCGCKAFHTSVAARLFNPLLEPRWLFDQEVLFRARLLRIPIASLPIHWTSQRGSKLSFSTLIGSAFRLPRLLLRTWWNFRIVPRKR